MNNYNFIIPVIDTDSLTISKLDGSAFSEEEINKLTQEINQLTDELIRWEFEFYIPKLIVIKSKNYVLDYGDGKIKTKGSSIRDQKKEPALAEMMNKMIDAMIYDKHDNLIDIYHEYIKEALNVKDIRRWCSKKTLTSAIFECKGWTQNDIKMKKIRKNEIDVWEAVKNEAGASEGDKIYTYPVILGHEVTPGGVSEKTGKPLKDKVKEITGLKLDKYWNQDHDVEKLVERVYSTVKIFELVLDMEQFIDYSSKKNKHLLENFK